MEHRVHYSAVSPKLATDLAAIGRSAKAGLDEKISHLVDVRASQLNRCSFCLDMHSKEAKLAGERELRLYHVAAWPESDLFTEKERVALKLTEQLTLHPDQGVSDELYDDVRAHFEESELVALVFNIGLINTWNRLNAVFQIKPGSYDKAFGLDRAGLS